MNYTTEQLELIAIMFKIQHGEKTVGDFFPDCEYESLKNIKIDELFISTETDDVLRDVNFLYKENLIMWFSYYNQVLHPIFGIYDDFDIPIDNIIKMLSFGDKI